MSHGNAKFALPNLLKIGEEVFAVEKNGTLEWRPLTPAPGTLYDWIGICSCCLERLLREAVDLGSTEAILIIPHTTDGRTVDKLSFHAGGVQRAILVPWR